jgi:HAD superfamily hydrolase (TIGR01509 family)
VYQAVLFDMDGVVVDTELSVAQFWQEIADDEGISFSPADLADNVHGRSAEHTLRTLFPAIPEDRYGQVYDRMRENNQRLRYSAITGVLDLLGELRDAGIPLALVTGAEDWKVVEVLRQLELTDAFWTEVRANDVPDGKPDPACYLLAAKRLGVGIDACLVFEDAVSGVTSAVTAGATCIALAPGQRGPRLLEHGAATTVPDFAHVHYTQADGLLHAGQDSAGQHTGFPLVPAPAAVRQ